MRKVLLYSVLLFIGLGLSQALPALLGDARDAIANAVRLLTMTGLAFIMIQVGFEFHLDKSNLKKYVRDYGVAFTAASFPWLLATGYFVFAMLPPEVWADLDAWKETLLAGRFAAPTSAGVLFSMLAAAGLGTTWVFRRARILAIFDDLDTVLLMIPLKMLMVGIAWQLGLVVVVMTGMLIMAFRWLHQVAMRITWGWVLVYAALIVGASELLHVWSTVFDPSVPIHVEVLLPAFVLGCMAHPPGAARDADTASLEHAFRAIAGQPGERRAATIVSAAFMVLVGLSMPAIFEGPDAEHPAPTPAALQLAAPGSIVDDPALHGGVPEAGVHDHRHGQPAEPWLGHDRVARADADAPEQSRQDVPGLLLPSRGALAASPGRGHRHVAARRGRRRDTGAQPELRHRRVPSSPWPCCRWRSTWR